jgi:hypothetical protein
MAKWEEIRDDLFEAIIQVQPTINKEQQADIVKIMRARGHDTSWNAIRYVYYTCQSWDENLAANSSHPEQVLGVATWLGLFPFLPPSASFFVPCPQLPICLTFLSASASLQVTTLHHHIFALPLETAQKPAPQTPQAAQAAQAHCHHGPHPAELGRGDARGHSGCPDRAHAACW